MGRDRLSAVAFRVVVIAGVCVFAVFVGEWLALVVNDASKAADYTAFMTGWTIVLDGRGKDLYDVATQVEVQRRLLGGLSFVAGLNPFNNPPHLVLPFVPLAVLPLFPSFLVWSALQFGLLAWLGWRLLTQVATGWLPAERVLMVVALIAMPPLEVTLLQGALSLLITVATLEAFIALRAGHERAAAFWLVVVTLKPQVAIAVAAAVVGGRRWRVVVWGLGLLAGTMLVATVVMGVGIWPDYVRFLGDYVGSFDVMSVQPALMWNLRGTITMLVGPDSAAAQADAINTVSLVAWIAGIIGITIWWARHDWDRGSVRFQLAFALTLVVGLLLSPHVNPHDGLLLAPAAALAYGALRTERYGPAFGAVLLAAPFLIVVTDPISPNVVAGPPVRVAVVIMVVMAIWIAASLARSPTRALPAT